MTDFEKWWESEGLDELEAYCNQWGIVVSFMGIEVAKRITNIAWLSSEKAASQRVIDQIGAAK